MSWLQRLLGQHNPAVLQIVLSGGQTGVDQAAHRAAMHAGILCSGWCPPDRSSEDGTIPSEFPLVATPRERSQRAPDVPRSLRTEWNVRDSDGTLILRPMSSTDQGTEWTVNAAEILRKPVVIVDPNDHSAVPRVVAWISEQNVHVLNVAGPSEGSAPGIGKIAGTFLSHVFKTFATKEGS